LNHVGGRGIAVRPPDDPLELEPDDDDDPDDPDEPDDPDDDEPELPLRDDDAPLVVPLDEPDVYPTPLMTFPCCCVSVPRTMTTGAP
jgi:hypothetical protein